jgi:ATP-dependent exoDNAse (exonuclease V) beta subunit
MTVDLETTTPHRVIRASAGSGKTFQLTSHYLRLLRAGAEPGAILATTFTRKAAGEIQGKVLTRLVEAIGQPDTRQDLARHTGGGTLTDTDCTHLLRKLVNASHRLAIATIDGFFNRMARSFRFELDLPIEPRLIDTASPTARDLRQQAVAAMLADPDVTEMLRLLRRLHHDTAARSVTRALDDIVLRLHETYRQAPRREQWDRLYVPPPMDDPTLQRAIEALQACEPDLPQTKAGAPNKTFAKALGQNVHDAWLGHWEQFITRGLAPKIANNEPKFSKQDIPQSFINVYTPLIEHARAALLDRVRQQNLARFDLLQRFDEHYQHLRRQQNVLLFSDLTDALARQMPQLEPGQLADIYFRLDTTVWHLLLDEFQDTSLDQWTVLHPFAEEITAHGEVNLQDNARSFFCVGDTKQAIYGWRGGCAALLDQLGEQLHLPDTAFEDLTKSFRSCPAVLDAVNAVFTSIADNSVLTENTEHAADAEAAAAFGHAFQAHEPAEHLMDTPGYVCLDTSPVQEDTADDVQTDDDTDSDETDAPFTEHEAFAADRVQQLFAAHPHQTIGVLVSTNKMAARLIHELRQRTARGQPLVVSGEGGAPLTDCPAVNAILSAFTLADHPGPARGRSAAAFHVANSPLGPVIDLTNTTPTAVGRASQHIRRALLVEGYANLLSRWIRQLAPACDRRNLARLEQLINLAEQYEPELTLRPERFVQLVENTPVEQAQPAPIRVMTLHRAKGLQFDTVVLPELDRPLTDDFDLLVQRDGPTGEVQAVHPCPRRALRELNQTLLDAHQHRRQQRRYEDLCGLYVALTRAKRALHLIIRPPKRTSKNELSKPSLSFAEILRTALSQVPRESETPGQTLFATGQADWTQPLTSPNEDDQTPAETNRATIDLASANATHPRRAWLAATPSTLDQASTIQAADLLTLGHEGRQRGTLIHRWLELVGFLDDSDGRPEPEDLKHAARALLPALTEDGLNALVDQFQQMLARPAIEQALQRDGADDRLWRERAFAVRTAGRLLQGRFDRVVLHADQAGSVQSATLIDFKTDRLNDDHQLETAAQRYRPQLNAYRQALAQLLDLDEHRITAMLAFVELGHTMHI